MFCRHFECGQEPGGEFRKQTWRAMSGKIWRLFWRKIVPYTWNSEQHRQTRRKEEFLNSRKTLQEII